MRARGREWLAGAGAGHAGLEVAPPRAPRPARPWRRAPGAVGHRIKTLIRDPYAIYARHVLRLRPLDPLRPTPDALARGIGAASGAGPLHCARPVTDPPDGAAPLLQVADEVLADEVPWPSARACGARGWTRSPPFLSRAKPAEGVPVLIEKRGRWTCRACPSG
jgi:ATP-dependent helicase/nuclease subunit B